MAGISSFRGRLRRRRGPGGVALWSSARAISSTVPRLPGVRIIERHDRRGEPITQEQPAPPDPPRGQIAAPCELVHRGPRDAEQVGHLPRRQDIRACQRALGWRSHLPKRGPEPPKRTPGSRLWPAPPGPRKMGVAQAGVSEAGESISRLPASGGHPAECRDHAIGAVRALLEGAGGAVSSCMERSSLRVLAAFPQERERCGGRSWSWRTPGSRLERKRAGFLPASATLLHRHRPLLADLRAGRRAATDCRLGAPVRKWFKVARDRRDHSHRRDGHRLGRLPAARRR